MLHDNFHDNSVVRVIGPHLGLFLPKWYHFWVLLKKADRSHCGMMAFPPRCFSAELDPASRCALDKVRSLPAFPYLKPPRFCPVLLRRFPRASVRAHSSILNKGVQIRPTQRCMEHGYTRLSRWVSEGWISCQRA